MKKKVFHKGIKRKQNQYFFFKAFVTLGLFSAIILLEIMNVIIYVIIFLTLQVWLIFFQPKQNTIEVYTTV